MAPKKKKKSLNNMSWPLLGEGGGEGRGGEGGAPGLLPFFFPSGRLV